ncbi:unnamed protein product [Vicia faba]|uniref:Uncharacterized protein n=1 Tax=Vicia faba TaxID=3906 RepID=A0AAV1B9L4_VICFA|nr:unnamed protein product [Vicia faba]
MVSPIKCVNIRVHKGAIKTSIALFVGFVFGIFIGLSFPALPLTKMNLPSNLVPSIDHKIPSIYSRHLKSDRHMSKEFRKLNENRKIWIPTNPRGAERLPSRIIESQSDFYLRRLWGLPYHDLSMKPKYLVTFTVGYDQRHNIDKSIKKFSENFTIVLFHYDDRISEWNQFEWSKRAIHISASKQTKWWYAKRFLHPDIVASYDYIFIWDEDLGLKHFDAEEYLKIVKKYGLEISQPGVDQSSSYTWEMTRRRDGVEVHKEAEEKDGWCSNPPVPPCAAFVEIMAPVFSRDAWRCVWHMIQNDLVHGWGLDFALRKCVESAHEKIGVVDAQWIIHKSIPSLNNQGQAESGREPWEGVRERCHEEWEMFKSRMTYAEKKLKFDI